MSVRLWLKDKTDGRVFEYGYDRHDSLCVLDGHLEYENLQNGDGTPYGYEWVMSDGSDPWEFNHGEDGTLNFGGNGMTANEYQNLARRTQNRELTNEEIKMHALFGMCSEVGEIQALYQKEKQGHVVDDARAVSEVGDLLWFVAEFLDSLGYTMDEAMQHNIDKLKARYPEGFATERSLHRASRDY